MAYPIKTTAPAPAIQESTTTCGLTPWAIVATGDAVRRGSSANVLRVTEKTEVCVVLASESKTHLLEVKGASM